MKMKKYLGLIAFVVFPIVAFASPQKQSHQKIVHYKNQRGSLLNIIFHPVSNHSGTITGTFKTAVASQHCQQVIGKAHPVAGFYTGNSVTLSMSYPSCGATVSVAGNFDKNNNIETLWIVANQGQDTDGHDWNTRVIGNDRFKRIVVKP